MWATDEEKDQHFRDTTFLDADERDYFEKYHFVFRVTARGVMDDGVQFVHLRYGNPVTNEWATQEFCHYEAFADASSFVSVKEDFANMTLEQALGPYGYEWEREQEERYDHAR